MIRTNPKLYKIFKGGIPYVTKHEEAKTELEIAAQLNPRPWKTTKK